MGRAGQGERPAGPLNPRRRQDYSSQRRQDCGGTAAALRRTTARLQRDYSSRRSGRALALCPRRRRAAGPGGGDGRRGCAQRSPPLPVAARALRPAPATDRPRAASRLPEEGPPRPSLGTADLPPSRSLPFLRRRTRDAFVRLRALGWARSSGRGHGRADGLGAAADHGQVRGGSVRAEPASPPRWLWGRCGGSGFIFCLLRSSVVWQKLCERCRKAAHGPAGG